jgi:hypothetical protein
MKHYVYKITDPITQEYYIGSRTCKCDIVDDSYMGSYKTWKPIDKERLVKIILKSDFIDRIDAILYEKQIIIENKNNKLNRNYHIPTVGFCTLGNIDVAMKISKSKKGKPSQNKGKVGIYSIETIAKMKKSAMERKPINDIAKEKISLANKGKLSGDKNPMYGMVGELNPNYGNKWSDTQKKIQSEKLKGKKRSNAVIAKMKIPIIQYDLTGNFIKEWDSLTSAANELKIYVGCINNCLRNRSKSSYGFVWKYKQIDII